MKIAHISDLHFGSLSRPATESLIRHFHDDKPDLVVASGDITQDATCTEFEEARAFFDLLPMPVFCIPGNHDLPGMDLERFYDPWGRYKRFIAQDLEPELRTDLVHLKGINTARRVLAHWNWANGSVSQRQCRDTRRAFAASTAPWRVFVMHHPVMNAREMPLQVALFNRNRLLRCLDDTRVDIVLAGHQHHAYIENRLTDGHTTLFLNASTTTSLRIRRQPNGFNMLNFGEKSVRIDRMELCGDVFKIVSAESHTKA
ncbi:metallophosphoesterase [Asticcacaulis sp. AC402]|uniref:metallophosphoesterase family protein n=1 Tax=Asticcacaulis sp. AC402 TaxID=1282361 RepID=UPI0003C3BF70|nr:metallophosphoesterase [Asticcacaulis sp. AC402]ESQ75848.1 metallophosphoesterase [Asticcacaulis sp. AC402]